MRIAIVETIEPMTLAEIERAHVARRQRLWPVAIIAPPSAPLRSVVKKMRDRRRDATVSRLPTRDEVEKLSAECAKVREKNGWPPMPSYSGMATARFLEDDGDRRKDEQRNAQREIVSRILAKYDMTWGKMIAPRQLHALAAIRFELMWELRRGTLMSLPQIGRLLNRDHTTVMHGVATHQARLDAARRIGRR